MKRYLSLFLFCAALAIAGCAHDSTARTAYKATASVVTTVDQAMTGWGAYVVSERTRIKAIADPVARLADASKLAAKEKRVIAAYDGYLAAATAGLSLAASSTNGPPVLTSQESNLIALIASNQL